MREEILLGGNFISEIFTVFVGVCHWQIQKNISKGVPMARPYIKKGRGVDLNPKHKMIIKLIRNH